MIDPNNVTKFNRTKRELEEFFLFSLAVAGKSAVQQAKKLDEFLKGVRAPFAFIRFLATDDGLRVHMKNCRLGKYQLLSAGFLAGAELGLKIRTAPREELAQVPGMGLKTASFFMLHSRPNQKIAVLDTYVLRYLQSQHPHLKIPRSSPGDLRHYRHLEDLFLGACMREEVDDIAAADLTCWKTKGKSINPYEW